MISNFFAWLLQVIMSWLAERVFKWFEERQLRKELEKKDAELLKKYDEVVNAGETLSREERRRLAEHFLNSGSI